VRGLFNCELVLGGGGCGFSLPAGGLRPEWVGQFESGGLWRVVTLQ